MTTQKDEHTLPAITVLPKTRAIVQEQEWGRLTWYASAELGNSANMTVGCCEIKAGCANPRHLHPNCEEVLHVLQGTITHTGANGEEILHPGDTVSVPAEILHNARNIGEDRAILLISFSSAVRMTQGE